MEFATPDVVFDGMRERLDKRIFGYTRVFEKSYYDAFSAWCQRRYGWTFDRSELVMSNGIIQPCTRWLSISASRMRKSCS